jgi:integrase/recombinase XerD
MALGKQAKVLTKQQIEAMLLYLGTTRHPERNRLIFLLSVRAGLRAKEIAGLTWAMVQNSDGSLANEMSLCDAASKGRSGRTIPMSKDLRFAISHWRQLTKNANAEAKIIVTERSRKPLTQVIINMFRSWYSDLGYEGCSSHSGRRTFITNAARRISTVGGSLRDIQELAGHSSLSTTQRYIETNVEAKRRIVELH